MLASTMGANILLWARSEVLAARQEALITQMKQGGLDPRSPSGHQGRPRDRQGRGGKRSQGEGKGPTKRGTQAKSRSRPETQKKQK